MNGLFGKAFCIAVRAALTLLLFSSSMLAQQSPPQIPVEWCDDAVVVADGRTMDIIDSILDFDELAVASQRAPATVFAYLNVVKNESDRITAFAGRINKWENCWPNIGTAISRIDGSIVIEIGQIDFNVQQYEDIRRLMFEHTRSSRTNAIFKITGRFERYNNNYEPYFRAQSVEVHKTTGRW